MQQDYKYKVATAQCEGMVKVEAARFEQALHPPLPRTVNYVNKLCELSGTAMVACSPYSSTKLYTVHVHS